MKDYINIKFKNARYVQRSQYAKLLIFYDNGTKQTLDNINQLDENIQDIINDMLKIKENPNNYFEYETLDDYPECIEITKYYEGNIKHLVIPEEINNKKVVSLSHSFDHNSKIETIVFPDGLKNIIHGCCNGMLNLKHVQLSPNITEIPPSAFSNCFNLKHINLENVNIIETCAFIRCNLLKDLNLENIKEIHSEGFKHCNSFTSIDLPNIEVLNKYAFANCKNLDVIILGDNLTEIPENAFDFCYNLTEVVFPNNLKIIGPYAFLSTKNLEYIKLPDSLENICEFAFASSGLIDKITIPPNVKKISETAFAETNITSINISKNTKFKNGFSGSKIKINTYDSIFTKLKNKFKDEER